MNYENQYKLLIEKRINNPLKVGYGEMHHILPKSLGGSDKKDNLVFLTAREHFVAHLLLVKIYQNNKSSHSKMVKAFHMMCCVISSSQSRTFNSYWYEKLRLQHKNSMSESQSGSKNSQFGSMWINDGVINKKIKKDEEIPEGFSKGRLNAFNPEYAKANLGKRYFYINNGSSETMIPLESQIPEGFVKGRLYRPPEEIRKKIGNSVKSYYSNKK